MQFECTEEEFRILEQIFQNDLKGTFGYSLALILLGLKPGTTPTVHHEITEYQEELDEMGLKTRTVKLDFVDYSELPDYAKEEKTHKPIFVSRSSENFDILKQEYSDRFEYKTDFGLFLGYPREDVEWHVNEAEEGNQNQYEKSKERLGNPDDFEQVVSAVMYIPKPTKERYQIAKNRAEKYVKALREADDKFNSSIGKELIQVQVNE